MKKQRFSKRIITLVLSLTIAVVMAGCSSNTSSTDTIKVKFGDAGWDSFRFHNAVAMLIGEAAYNIEAEEVSGSTAVTYTALKSGDIQVYMETWTNGLPTYEDDIAAGTVKELSVNFDDNAQGFYVPRYVIEGDEERGIEALTPDLKTVSDLAKYSDVFIDPDDPSMGRLYGAISGWEVDTVMRNKYVYYGLDENYNYIDPGSDAALAAAISSAYQKGQAIVAYYWEPTWITGKYDLVLLEDEPYNEDLYDEGKCAFPSMNVTISVNPDFIAAAPEYCEFLSNYKTSSALTAEALSYMQDSGASYEEAAIWFLNEHEELLTEWLPVEKLELVSEAINN